MELIPTMIMLKTQDSIWHWIPQRICHLNRDEVQRKEIAHRTLVGYDY
jgi:hypothetical protein